MKIKFQADADLNQAIVKGLRRRQAAIDFQSAQDAGLRGLSDQDVLARAASEGRILVSHDFSTMPSQFAAFSAAQQSPGVFLIAQDAAIGTAVDELWLIWETSDAEEWAGLLQWLPL